MRAMRYLAAVALLWLVPPGHADAQVIPSDTPLEALEKSDNFIRFRYASWRASDGQGLRSYTMRFDVPIAHDQEFRLDVPAYVERLTPDQNISGFPGFTLSYFKDFNGGQRFRFLTSAPSGQLGLSAEEWIVAPQYSISGRRGPFALSSSFTYTLGLFPTGPGPASNILSASPGISYSFKRFSIDLDYNLYWELADSGLGSGTAASLGPDISYALPSGLSIESGYAFPLSRIRDSRIFQREFYIGLSYRGRFEPNH